MGMCFGVRRCPRGDRWDIANRPRSRSTAQLVHNEVVQAQLEARGFAIQAKRERAKSLPETPAVLITAHGISDRERRRLWRPAASSIVDTTCPLVTRVHQAARSLEARGYHVLVIGRRGHVEVEGIIGDLEHSDVIESGR